ncbi:hypothetical protein P154DRAFT_311598 [Amniculicola lignicola CBS 123094]|uniref:Uncharacterized protein n=1 Tax=Amniculicola lignicola CBS 123094 TaxID=1392246 RepID=A0A6A5W3P1_9PLEO|nr:hypothetical protein P154DRAFT_311598 [Amniculicola lignicola CBS 123094]
MSQAPLTPGEELDPEPASPSIDYSPATVPYDEAFENQLMHAILHPSSHPPRTPSSEHPQIAPACLPVPLNSHIRTHPSPIPGVLLTHPNGYHTGGPGPSPSTVRDYADEFIKRHGIEDAEHLQKVVEEEIRKRMEEVKERMREREEAVRKNEEVNKSLLEKEMQRGVEVRIHEKIRKAKEERRG